MPLATPPTFLPPQELWRATTLAQATKGVLRGESSDARAKLPLSSISIDTRTIEPGAVFFAIRGETFDGHAFVEEALKKGAALAVVERKKAAEFSASLPLLVVEDVLLALEAAGQYRRATSKALRLAVTGSVGKTSTKEMARLAFAALSGAAGRVHASVASYNNHWGVPLTLARMPEDSRYGLFEIGMSHPFEILPLSAMVRPHVAIVTAIEPVHLAAFHAMEGIADAKGEVFSGLTAGGTAILPADNPYIARLMAHAGASQAGRVLRFGRNPNSDIRLVDLLSLGGGSRVKAQLFGQEFDYIIGAPGEHFAMNSLAILGAVHVMGGDVQQAAASFVDFSSIEGRGKRLSLQKNGLFFTLIDESYNANPASMRAALRVLGATKLTHQSGRRIAILGDMLELGGASTKLHVELLAPIVENKIDLVFTAGSVMKHLYDSLPPALRGEHAATAQALTPTLEALIQEGDVLMIKGSFSSNMRAIVASLQESYRLSSPSLI